MVRKAGEVEMKEYIVRYENEYLQLLPDKMQELVRCIDCEYHRHDDWCTELHGETKQNDYCSWGVKKDE
jgi:hypothetical protein